MPLQQSEVSLASNPIDLNISRSRVTQRKTVSDTFDSSTLIPFYVKDVLPGTTIEMNVDALVRLNTPIHPTMDSAFLDLFWFFVPFRLTWDHFVNLRGEDSNTYWEPVTDYTVPQIVSPEGGWNVGSIADHMGIRPLVGGISVSALPFRGLALIWNEYFRSEFLSQPISVPTNDADVNGENGTWSDYITKGYLGGDPLRVARFHDLFSDGLLEPQSGDPITVPFTGYAPVYPMTNIDNTELIARNATSLKVGTLVPYFGPTAEQDFYTYEIANTSNPHGIMLRAGQQTGRLGNVGFETGTATEATASWANGISPVNLGADLTKFNGIGVTINDLRQAAVTQQVLETLNRGNRYVEILENAFHVQSPDARLQRPEFLATRRIPISMQEINQTSSTDSTSPLGTSGATSKTFAFDDEPMFRKSFVEDGMIYCVGCVRPSRTYSQSVPMWMRKKERFDFFYPQMQGLGDRPIPMSSIYAQSDSVVTDDGTPVNDEPFAYQQAWFEYFTDYNEVRGLFRPDVPSNLASWNYAEHYEEMPTYSTEWMYDVGQISRTIAVQNEPEFRIQLQFTSDWVLPMQVGRAPGITRI